MSRVFYPQARAVLQIVFDGFSLHAKDTDPQIIPILPIEATIHRNSYRQADSWELTFDANDLPIDPQLVRSGAAEIFLFQTDVSGRDLRIMSRQHTVLSDTTDMDGKPRDVFDAQMLELGLRKAKDKFTFGNAPMIAGLIDDVSLEMGTGGKTVHISGQDYTAYLISRQWPPTKKGRARRIPTGMRLDKFVEQMLVEADPQKRLKVKVENIDEKSLPTVGDGETRGKRRGIPVEQDTSYWDVIYKTVTRYGAICFVRGLDVVITRPSALREEFDHRIRRLAWGNNVESLELTRHLGKEKVPRVIVRGYDEKTQQTVTVEFPREPASQKTEAKKKKQRGVKRKSAIPEGTIGVEEDEYQIIPVYGISDPIRLYEVAQNIFTLLGQAERRVRVTTNDLNDFEGNSMLDMHPGDPITIGFKDFNKEMLANDEVSPEAKIGHLMSRGYNEAVARVIASHYKKFDFLKRPLRIREMTYEYSVTGGITTEIEAVDFVVIDGQRDPNQKKRRTAKHIERVAEVKR